MTLAPSLQCQSPPDCPCASNPRQWQATGQWLCSISTPRHESPSMPPRSCTTACPAPLHGQWGTCLTTGLDRLSKATSSKGIGSVARRRAPQTDTGAELLASCTILQCFAVGGLPLPRLSSHHQKRSPSHWHHCWPCLSPPFFVTDRVSGFEHHKPTTGVLCVRRRLNLTINQCLGNANGNEHTQ